MNHRSNLLKSVLNSAVFPLIALLVFLAIGIHRKTSQAIAPPIYDPLGYIQKGHSIWNQVSDRKLRNPLNAVPAFRPPGVVPFAFPFGYSPRFNSFLFWNTFSPIVLWVVALWLALRKQIQTTTDRWNGIALCVGLASLPLFYHFEINPVVD